MSIVLNLGMSRTLLALTERHLADIVVRRNWQKVDILTMQFPSEMLIDYIRVY